MLSKPHQTFDGRHQSERMYTDALREVQGAIHLYF